VSTHDKGPCRRLRRLRREGTGAFRRGALQLLVLAECEEPVSDAAEDEVRCPAHGPIRRAQEVVT